MKVIATSRERLNLDSETLFRLGGMDFLDWETPEAALQYSVVKLFLQSARRVQPEFNVTADNLLHLARICRQVEGMPLGILLSAAWIETLSLKEISEEINASLDFLETERRDIPERQRSIRAVLDSSWKTLTEHEKAVFKKLSVFRGGFTREAAQQAAGASLRELTALLDKSVLRRDPQTGRYDIHDLLRQYGAERLVAMPQEELDAQEAHCRHFATFMGTREPLLFRQEQLVAMAEIRRDFDNVRVAWDVAIKRGLASEFRPMALCLFAYLWRSGPQEYELFFAPALEQWEKRCEPGPAEICLALALFGFGLHYSYSGRREKTYELFRRSLSLLRRYDSPRETLPVLLGAAYEEVDQAEKIKLFQECLKLAQSIDNESWIGEAYMGLAQSQFWRGNDQEADALLQKADEAAQRSGDRNLLRNVLGVKANRTSRQGTYRQEAAYVQQIVIYSRELGRTPFALYDASWLAHLEALQGNYEAAAQQLDAILASARELGVWPVIASVIAEMTFAAYLQKQYENAKTLGQQALSMYRQHEATPWWFLVVTLGHANAALAAYKEAEAQYLEAMLWGKTNQNVAVILESIIGIASLLGKANQPVRAVELVTLTYTHPSCNAWLKQLGNAFIAPLQSELPADVFAAAQERAKTLDLDIVVTELLNSPPIFPG